MGNNLTIFQKGLGLVAVPLLFQFCFLGLVLSMQRGNREAQEWAYHTQEVLSCAHDVLGTTADAQAGVRGYTVTADPAFTEPFQRSSRELPYKLEQLGHLVRDDPGQEARAQRIAAGAAEVLAWLAETERLVRSGDREGAVARVKTRAGKRLMDQTRAEVAAFLVEESQRAAQRRRTLERRRQGMNVLLLAGGLAAFACSGLLAFAFGRGVGGRLARLSENARRLGRGERLAGPLGGADEVAQLDRAFHDMAADLTGSRAALREHVETLQSILESMGDGVVVADGDGSFLVFNPAAERMFGKPQTSSPPEAWSQEYGLFLPDRETRFPADQLPLVRAVRGEDVDDVEMFVRHPGSPPGGKWVTITGRPLGGRDGGRRCGVVVCRDVTERKRAEEAVRRLNEELESRVRRRTAELAEANRDLLHKNAENEMFVFSVSHDLRSPLVNLLGFSEELDKGCVALTELFDHEAIPAALREQGAALLGGKMARSLGFIQSAVLRLSGIIDALLRLSRAGRVEYRWDLVDVAGLVERVLGAMHGTITGRGVRVCIGELPPVTGDPTALEQVFANLVGNALTYLDPARPGAIEIGCLPPGGAGVPDGFWAFFVRDNGLGIAEAHRGKIFQVFQRAHPSVSKGEGMGLAIVTRVAARHGGRAWVESRVGEGSCFFVTLPAAPGAAGAKGAAAAPGLKPRTGGTSDGGE